MSSSIVEIKDKILSHPKISKIIEKYKLNQNQINSGLLIFLEIIEEQSKLSELNFVTKIIIQDENTISSIKLPYGEMKKKIEREKYLKLPNITFFNPNLTFDKENNPNLASLSREDKFFWSLGDNEKQNRTQIALWFKNFYKTKILTNNEDNNKGFYLDGPFGSGKTTFMMAFANYLVEKQKTTVFFSLNDLYQNLKSKINSQSEEILEITNQMKYVEYLLIDDIGAEKPNEWLLFSILYPVLDFRMNSNKFVAFSSNFTIQELSKYYKKQKGLDPFKINRLIDRIECLTKEIKIFGDNIRKKINF